MKISVNVCASTHAWETHDKHVFVVTKHLFCCDKSMLVATKLLSRQTYFVATTVLLQQAYNKFCHDKTHLLSQEKYACHDKTIFSWQAYFCCDKRHVLSWQKLFVATQTCGNPCQGYMCACWDDSCLCLQNSDEDLDACVYGRGGWCFSFVSVWQENRGLQNSNEDLNAQLMNRCVEEGKSLLLDGGSKSLAEELDHLTKEEVLYFNNAPRPCLGCVTMHRHQQQHHGYMNIHFTFYCMLHRYCTSAVQLTIAWVVSQCIDTSNNTMTTYI